MIEDMTVRNQSPTTQRSYIHAVKSFSQHFWRSPDRMRLDEVHAYQVHLVGNGMWAMLNQTVSALRFLYGVTRLAAELVPAVSAWMANMRGCSTRRCVTTRGAGRSRRPRDQGRSLGNVGGTWRRGLPLRIPCLGLAGICVAKPLQVRDDGCLVLANPRDQTRAQHVTRATWAPFSTRRVTPARAASAMTSAGVI
jgi:hypothetical protein